MRHDPFTSSRGKKAVRALLSRASAASTVVSAAKRQLDRALDGERGGRDLSENRDRERNEEDRNEAGHARQFRTCLTPLLIHRMSPNRSGYLERRGDGRIRLRGDADRLLQRARRRLCSVDGHCQRFLPLRGDQVGIVVVKALAV